MAYSVSQNRRPRLKFSSIGKVVEIPNLIEVQKESYDRFLQADVAAEKRRDVGLQKVFQSVFPIKDFAETASLEFVKYELGEPKYDVEECTERGMTFACPVKVTVRLVVWDVDEEGGAQSVRDVKEQEVYFGEIPVMTKNGTFVINGTERVIVNQLHRSPGVFFSHDEGKRHSSGKYLYSARVIPYRGSWLDFEFNHKDLLFVRIDRRRKFPATVLLKALGYSAQDILDNFYDKLGVEIDWKKETAKKAIDPDLLEDSRATENIVHPESGAVLVKAQRKVNKRALKRLRQDKVTAVPIEIEDLKGAFIATDIVDKETGEITFEAGTQVTTEILEEMREANLKKFEILFIDNLKVGSYVRDTLVDDKISSTEEGIIEIYRRMRPGDPPTLDTATKFFENLFFNDERYDISKVGRRKLNYKLKIDAPMEQQTLTREDILAVVRYLANLKNGRGSIDDIDHLGNRRVRSVGELLENRYRVGLVRMERAVKERMSLHEVDSLMPHDLINSKPVTAVVKEFFGSGQLSQFMDQTNPLSETTHKRRLSALGPGGLTRERAGFEVRDVHTTHYGRICPIETPEGPNIGLIVSLSIYARVDEYGFIETPYRKVSKGKVLKSIQFLSAMEEEEHTIAQANAPIDAKGKFENELINARRNGDPLLVDAAEVDLMDVSPKQLVSVAAALIPFLEHDDANRALMGSNMQRQAVPLLSTEAPLVGTGIEAVVAHDSGVTVVADRDGLIESVDSSRIVVKTFEEGVEDVRTGVDIYNLTKFQRSNQNTCLNQRPIVKKGDMVKAGDVLADGPATSAAELALGKNVVVAFMSWGGYNYEDSIIISEKLLERDIFTSVHIEEFECVARDTKLGKEEITPDIPNLGDRKLKDLDEQGIIRVGAQVRPGDLMVGKVTPKGETQLSPEEKLLRAIFGEKAGDVKDTSLRVPPGVEGIVVDTKVFSRKGAGLDDGFDDAEDREGARLREVMGEEIAILSSATYNSIRDLLSSERAAIDVVDLEGNVVIAEGEVIDPDKLQTVPKAAWVEIPLIDALEKEDRIFALAERLDERIAKVRTKFEERIERLQEGDDLLPGVIKMVKVYVAIKRRLSVGDKMAGRHGNKGVISKIVPVEDMPYLEDGRQVDVILNPLGVPSRMNVGQVLETHLGWAAHSLSRQVQAFVDENYSPDVMRSKLKEIYSDAETQELLDSSNDDAIMGFARMAAHEGVATESPVFDGASETSIREFLTKAGCSESGQELLYNGLTGEPFDQRITVGVMYMLKLHHLVGDKIHARSTGPYSLVTQQPLGGKAQFGGQRLGEMEVWALEAYGASHILQEMLTVKSDDVAGRTRIYESIVKGKNVLEPGLPESFNVLIKEMQALGLDVELLEEEEAL
ncbi:MAG: DNA-directed RNA polymerase subunit beta [Deltaproteobacteria bacterium]|nr:MAG: DNA-directed RNA polymerase subunit beta [Deltaproteobacteria bacterium]